MPTIRAIFHIRDERLAPDIGGVARIGNWRFYQSANLESDYPYRSRAAVALTMISGSAVLSILRL
jgi:hypothetical protein